MWPSSFDGRARQQLYCKAADRYGPGLLQSLEAAGISFESGKEMFPNVVSSYVTEGVFGKSAWVSEGLYKDILEGFDHRPAVKINLVDGGQSFVPFFTGHLNFISSNVSSHWHLFLLRPGTNELYRWGPRCTPLTLAGTVNFDPRTREMKLYRDGLEKEMLFPYIVSLCKEFYSLQSQQGPIDPGASVRYPEKGPGNAVEKVHPSTVLRPAIPALFAERRRRICCLLKKWFLSADSCNFIADGSNQRSIREDIPDLAGQPAKPM
ncbi:MAG TPA: hypothetical protein VGR89_01920 [Puia sp.]|nr:hypothetical protein [Puia sp.]